MRNRIKRKERRERGKQKTLGVLCAEFLSELCGYEFQMQLFFGP